MRTIKPYKMGALTRVFSHASKSWLGVTPMYAFPLEAGRSMLTEPDLWNTVRSELGDSRFDPGIRKQRAETLITGRAYAPDKAPVQRLTARAWVRRQSEDKPLIDQSLEVIGDRLWVDDERWQGPEPFTEMPLRWERAFGGGADSRNPIGRGHHTVDTAAAKARALPNIEHPAHLIATRADEPPPAAWDVRPHAGGNFDDAWNIALAEPAMQLAEDQWFEGGEIIHLENLHPDEPVIEWKVPRIRLRAWYKPVGKTVASGMREIDTRFESLWLFPQAKKAVALFRGEVPITKADGSDVELVMFGAEDMATPKERSHYVATLSGQAERTTALAHADLLPDGEHDDEEADEAAKADPAGLAPSASAPAVTSATAASAALATSATAAAATSATAVPSPDADTGWSQAKEDAFQASLEGPRRRSKGPSAASSGETRAGGAYDHLFRVRSEHLPPQCWVVAFRGEEALSEPYTFAIDLLVDRQTQWDMDAAVGERLRLLTKHDDQGMRMAWHGIVASVEHRQQEDEADVYRVTMVPSLWRLTQSRHSRVFTDMSVPEIIAAIFDANSLTPGHDYRLALNASYPKLAHVCQYQESDFDFISRWMEREGIYYFFEHDPEPEADREVMVLCDELHHHDTLRSEGVRYRTGAAGEGSSGQAFSSFRGISALRPKQVNVRDYDDLRPDMGSPQPSGPGIVNATATALPAGSVDVVDHRYGGTTTAEAKRLATIRSQELLASRKIYTGHGQIFRMRSGYVFQLDEHRRFEGDYLTTRVRHYGNQSGGGDRWNEIIDLPYDDEYRVDVVAIPKEVPFRPSRQTPCPRIYGMENATIDGVIDGEYAQIDEHGRYKVKFHFDESMRADGRASTWVRRMQPHGGNPEGFHFPLRKGTEVVVSFFGGDPDRPFIAGVVPNQHTPSKVVDANHKHNVIHTSHDNRIDLHDDDGKQYIDHSTPPQNTWAHMGEPGGDFAATHYFHKHTDGNELIDIGTDREIEVGRDQNEHVVANVNETYDANHTRVVAMDQTFDVTGNHTETIQGEYVQNLMSTHTQETTADWFSYKKANTASVTIGATANLSIGVTTNTFIGIKNVNFIGGQLNLTVAAKADFNLALQFEATYGWKYTVGPGMQEQRVAKKRQTLLALNEDLNAISKGAFEVRNKQFYIIQ